MCMKVDCILTNVKRFTNRALRATIVPKNWGELLDNKSDLPDDEQKKRVFGGH